MRRFVNQGIMLLFRLGLALSVVLWVTGYFAHIRGLVESPIGIVGVVNTRYGLNCGVYSMKRSFGARVDVSDPNQQDAGYGFDRGPVHMEWLNSGSSSPPQRGFQVFVNHWFATAVFVVSNVFVQGARWKRKRKPNRNVA
jgi:hypothetical protein